MRLGSCGECDAELKQFEGMEHIRNNVPVKFALKETELIAVGIPEMQERTCRLRYGCLREKSVWLLELLLWDYGTERHSCVSCIAASPPHSPSFPSFPPPLVYLDRHSSVGMCSVREGVDCTLRIFLFSEFFFFSLD